MNGAGKGTVVHLTVDGKSACEAWRRSHYYTDVVAAHDEKAQVMVACLKPVSMLFLYM